MAHRHPPVKGVYAVTPDQADTTKLMFAVSEALAGGVRLLQYRNKSACMALALEQCVVLRRLTASAGAILIINDDIELAFAVSADGVHLGRNDCRVDDLSNDLSAIRQYADRKNSGPFLIGLSCYNEFDRARVASDAGADYIAFGSFFPSPTKPNATQVDVSLIRSAKAAFSLPLVAIGGITPENAPQLLAAGADSVAVITSLFDAENIRERAKLFSSLFPEDV